MIVFFFIFLAAKAIIDVLKDTRHIYVCDIGDHISKVYSDEMKNLMKKNKPKKKTFYIKYNKYTNNKNKLQAII